MKPRMKIQILREAGYNAALFGLSLNKKQPLENMDKVAKKLANKDGGHNKFLEHIMVWIKVTTTRYIWQEMDTYRLSSKQSESTMHTALKEPLSQKNFETKIPNDYLDLLNKKIEENKLTELKALLPEGFIQTREWCMSYKTLRNIILQRKNHRLPHWRIFIESVLSQVKHPELLPEVTWKS